MSDGLKFKKFDLHVHTPASSDYEEKSIKPRDVVDEAISKQLAGIAIADHQTGAWVDKVKKAAKGTKLVIFPATELKIHGGEKGIHLIVLFDVDKDSSHISAFLNTIKVYEHNGKPDLIANKTAIDIARELQEFDPTAILVLAHCLSSQGVVGEMKGEQRSEIFRPEYCCLLGAEASENDFKDTKKIQDHDRIIDLFDGGYEQFHKKRLGVYQASDAHSLKEIGEKATYFKVDENISIEDLRQCLIDRDTRIRQLFEYKDFVYPYISKLKVTNGFLENQEFNFHNGLNSLLGAKGAGKSLAIEFLRFALFQPSSVEEVKKDYESKLEKCLGLHGTVEVTVSDESGKKYFIQRNFNPAENNPTKIIDLTDDSNKEFEVEKVFPVLFLSQNEIIKIAEDRSGASQRGFIDRFFDFYKYQQEIKDQNKILEDVDTKFAESLRAHLLSTEIQKRIATCKEEIDKLDRQIDNKVFEKYSKQEKIGRAIKNQISFLDSLKESLKETGEEYSDLVPPQIEDSEIDSVPSVKSANDIASSAVKRISELVDSLFFELDEKKSMIEREFHEWEIAFNEVKGEYDRLVIETGGNQVILDQRRKKLTSELSGLENDLSKHQGKAQQLEIRSKKRTETISRLEKAYKAYFDQRRSRCEYFTSNSSGSLKVTIKEMEDKTAFKNNLRNLKRGSWIKDEDIEVIAEKVSPKDFIEAVMSYEKSGKTSKEQILRFSGLTGLKEENIEKLLHHLLEEYSYENILGLLYTSVPEDVPSISYRVGTVYKPLSELSVGQKAVALLVIALSDGTFPIVIDQPEDSLDLRSIWDDVCLKLRDKKDNRQFIFTTHNSSVAVASDTDKFTILQSDASRGRIMFSGSINQPDIKREVIDYLEGGEETYEKKRLKYVKNKKA
jgi:hypothetical protein